MIFCHISGLQNFIKKELITKFPNYIFKDLEDYTQIIINDKNMQALIQRYEYYLEKSKSSNVTKLQSKQFIKKSKDIERQMNNYWKTKINYYIIDLINKSDPKKKIILLGNCNFFKNIRIFINIQTNLKIFIDDNSNDNIKDIIKNNLDQYRNDIINGNYNLEQLNYNYLIKKREILKLIYIKNGYSLKTYDNLIKLLLINNNIIDNPNILYYASDIDYNKKINLSKIIAYSDDWISLVSSIKTKQIIKGFENDDHSKPFIQELEPNLLSKLKCKTFLYVINNTSLFVPIFTKNYIYKYETNKSVQIYKKLQIDNIYNILKEKKIKLIEYV